MKEQRSDSPGEQVDSNGGRKSSTRLFDPVTADKRGLNLDVWKYEEKDRPAPPKPLVATRPRPAPPASGD